MTKTERAATGVSRERLERALNPRTVVVVGDAGARGYRWLKCMSTFTGKVYSVQVDPKEIAGIEALGFENYKSVTEVPGDVDYVLMAVPRAVSPIVLRDCIAKGVAGVAMFTSGFAETRTPEGLELQARITQMARESGLALIGPNCMGLYNPGVGVRFGEGQAAGTAGDVVFLSQSGGHGGDFAAAAQAAGVPVRMVVSFGNGVVLHHHDYLEYFADDPETRFIAMYVEGVTDRDRFLQALRRVVPQKPVVLWKGGLTAAGGRATAAHTASLAGSEEIWEAVSRQTGVIRANSTLEMMDLLKALRMLPPFTGDAVGLTGGSGGQSVAMADVFSRAGLRVPELAPASRERLASWFSLVGASFSNPIDMGSNRAEVDTIMDTLIEDPTIDSIVVQVRLIEAGAATRRLGGQIDAIARLKQRTQKPVAAILYSMAPYDDGPAMADLDARLREIGVPAYANYERAASAMRKVMEYYRYREQA